MNKRMSYLAIVAICLAAVLGIARTSRTAGKPAAEIKIVSDDIGGVVTSSKGPEAGVWVIAETKDLPTGYRKIVVTDDLAIAGGRSFVSAITHTPASAALRARVCTPPMWSETILISAAGFPAVRLVRAIPICGETQIATIARYDILLFMRVISFGGWAKARASAVERRDA